jgi:hypothetical protein
MRHRQAHVHGTKELQRIGLIGPGSVPELHRVAGARRQAREERFEPRQLVVAKAGMKLNQDRAQLLAHRTLDAVSSTNRELNSQIAADVPMG